MSILKGQPQTINYLEFDGVNDFVDIDNNVNSNVHYMNITFKPDPNEYGTLVSGLFADGFQRSLSIADKTDNQYNYDIVLQIPNNGATYFDSGLTLSNQINKLEIFWQNNDYSVFVNDNQSTKVHFVGDARQLIPYNRLKRIGNRTFFNDRHYYGNIYHFEAKDESDNLIVKYDFSEGSGTTLNDGAGNNDGIISGATWGGEQVLPEIQNIYKGETEISKVFKGTDLIFQSFAPIQATGGTITTYEDNGTFYKSHTFTSSGNFVVNSLGTNNELDYLIIAGGGGGGGQKSNAWRGGGGGGAGGYQTTLGTSGGNSTAESKIIVSTQTYSIVVGGGGIGGSPGDVVAATSGTNTSAFGIISTAGGHGAQFTSSTAPNFTPGNGGSGGGGSSDRTASAGEPGSGIANQGFDGGNVVGNVANRGGGGGGAGQVGGNGSTNTGGNGGNGLGNILRTGSSENRAGGGGGAGSSTGGIGGTGGGGNGRGGNGNGFNATTNTGGGGGAAGGVSEVFYTGGNGASGIVIIRYEVGEL